MSEDVLKDSFISLLNELDINHISVKQSLVLLPHISQLVH